MKHFDLIEAYLNGTLSAEDRQAFERRLENDPPLKEEFDFQRMENDMLQLLVEDDVREMIGNLKTTKGLDRANTDVKETNNSRQNLILILGLLLLAPIAWLWFMNREKSIGKDTPPIEHFPIQTPPTEEATTDLPIAGNDISQEDETIRDLTTEESAKEQEVKKEPKVEQLSALNSQQIAYLSTQIAYRQKITLRSDTLTNTPEGRLTASLLLYQQEQYEQVIEQLQSVPSQDGQYVKAQELLGLANFKLVRYATAAQHFSIVSQSDLPPYDERADWNYLLCQALLSGVANSEFASARQAISADPSHFYYSNMIQVFDTLPKIKSIRSSTNQ